MTLHSDLNVMYTHVFKALDIEKVSYDEKSFRWALNEDPCASVKLAVCRARMNH